MKRTAITLSALVFAGTLVATGALAETKIVYANYLGLKQPTNIALSDHFAAVEKDTNGSVKWEAHFASSLLGPKDIPAGVRDGIAKEVLALRAKWDGLLAKNGRDQATFEKLLWDEVYSKVAVN